MGAVFAAGSVAGEFQAASPEAVAAGMRVTFVAAAAGLVAVALIIASGRLPPRAV